jgi:Uncharacterised nucleotidyltransferase
MSEARLLTDALATGQFPSGRWNDLVRMARAESLLGQLAHRLQGAPPRVRAIPCVLLKGAAYVALGHPAARGRTVGDLDILVPRDRLDEAEHRLQAAGWAWLKDDPYDDLYYRRWMHELPPLAHSERGTLIDVHHSILPLTARLTPNPAALLAAAVPVAEGLAVLSPEDRILHAAAHCFYDGEFEGGLRNLWDIHCLVGKASAAEDFWPRLAERAALHQLTTPLARALRHAKTIYGTTAPQSATSDPDWLDPLIHRRLTDRNRWGYRTRPWTERALYVRGHWLRMPPLLLARHLWTKWRR